MRHRIAIAAIVLAAAAPLHAQELLVQKPVPWAEDNDIADNIKTECKLQEQLADFVKQYSTTPVKFTGGPIDLAQGRVLQLEIVDAISMGNAFLGHQKATKVKGALWENGRRVAGFKARRNSMGGAFAGYKGSCSVLGRTVEAIGEDIGNWLKAPVDGANLGD